jgi:hypothetical protein
VLRVELRVGMRRVLLGRCWVRALRHDDGLREIRCLASGASGRDVSSRGAAQVDWPATPGKGSQDGAAPGSARQRRERTPLPATCYLLQSPSPEAGCSKCCASLAAWPRESSAHADARMRQVPVAQKHWKDQRTPRLSCTTKYSILLRPTGQGTPRHSPRMAKVSFPIAKSHVNSCTSLQGDYNSD